MGGDNMNEDIKEDVLTARLSDPHVRAQILRILDRLDLIEEAVTSNNAIRDLQTEGMIERLSERVEKAIQLLDQVSNPNIVGLVREIDNHYPTIASLLKSLSDMEQSGKLASLLELTQGAKALNDILNDSFVERMALQVETLTGHLEQLRLIPVEDLTKFLGSLKESGALDTLPEIAGALVALRRLMTDTLLERVMTLIDQGIAYQNSISTAIRMIPENPKSPVGLMGLWTLINDPEIQKSLYVFMSALKVFLKEK
ncbi:MAG: DUF1641 domain-containing protein [Leptospirillum sp.]|jgi:uncharacterized protein YjgD (DUF1641 family)